MTEPAPRTFEQTVRIATSPETVWRYWTDLKRMYDWRVVADELDPRPGGSCRRAGWAQFVNSRIDG